MMAQTNIFGIILVVSGDAIYQSDTFLILRELSIDPYCFVFQTATILKLFRSSCNRTEYMMLLSLTSLWRYPHALSALRPIAV